jgi:hypothetical protein
METVAKLLGSIIAFFISAMILGFWLKIVVWAMN